MSNITVKCESFEGTATSPSYDRYYVQRISFKDLEIRPSKEDIEDNIPTGIDISVQFKRIEQLNITKPDFITQKRWDELAKTSSCFISANGTLMPKMIIPDSDQVIDNGVVNTEGEEDSSQKRANTPYVWKAYEYTFPDEGSEEEASLETIAADKLVENANRVFLEENQTVGYINISSQGELKTSLSELLKIQRAFVLDETNSDLTEYNTEIGDGKGGAAFSLVLSFDPYNLRQLSSEDEKQVVPKIRIEMGDDIEISIAKSGEFVTNIDGQITPGSLVKTDASQKPMQSLKSDSFFVMVVYPVWNGLVVQSGIQDNKDLVAPASLYCIYKNMANIIDFSKMGTKFLDEISINDFTDDVEVKFTTTRGYEKNVELDWGTDLSLYWIATRGEFSYNPVYFIPNAKCTVVFKDRKKSDASTYDYYAYTIYSNQQSGGDFSCTDNSADELEEIDDYFSYYKFDFEFSPGSDEWSRRGLEAWDYIKVTKEHTDVNMKNSNGSLKLSQDMRYESNGAVDLSDWQKYIKSVQIRIGLEGASGTINFDKYAMKGQVKEPPQSVGGIKIKVEGGNSDVLNSGGDAIFSGLYMGVGDNSTETDDTYSVSLYGLEKKLEDMKLINAPFWDGDKLYVATDFVCGYSNIDYNFSDGDRNADLPRSSDFENPAVNFTHSTSCIEALRKLAEWTNHTTVIQPDGKIYFYEYGDYGVPKVVSTSTEHVYSSTLAMSIDNAPTFENMYNAFMTVGITPINAYSRDPGSSLSTEGVNVFPDIIFDDNNNTDPDIPWLKLFVYGQNGVVTRDTLQNQHDINVSIGSQFMTRGSVTVPGDDSAKIYDRIKLVDSDNNIILSGKWYIYEITHNVNLQSKQWTTSYSIGRSNEA